VLFIYLYPLGSILLQAILTVDADVKQAVTSWLEALDADFFYATMQDLVPRINVAGSYVERLMTLNNVLGIRILVRLLVNYFAITLHACIT